MARFVTMFKNQIRIACKMGTMVRLGRFCMKFDDAMDVSKPLWLPNPNNPQELLKQEEPPQQNRKRPQGTFK
jgi:hypothetical protein